MSDYAAMLNLASVEARFAAIEKHRLWGSEESVSGPGSTSAYTQNLVPQLAALLQRHNIKSVVDAPCGDLNWMAPFIAQNGIKYYGFDLVPAVVNAARQRAPNNAHIAHGDIRSMDFPQADLWLCRDCWFHFSERDIKAALQNFLRSQIPYALLTTHINDTGFANRDITSGDFRLLDLMSAPFNFPRDYVDAIDDWIEPFPRRRLVLWRREQLAGLEW
jgi:hypothetical protein